MTKQLPKSPPYISVSEAAHDLRLGMDSRAGSAWKGGEDQRNFCNLTDCPISDLNLLTALFLSMDLSWLLLCIHIILTSLVSSASLNLILLHKLPLQLSKFRIFQ